MEKSLKDLEVGDYVKCRRNIRKFVSGELYKVQKSSNGYLKITSGMTHEAYEKMAHTIYLTTSSGGLCSIFEEPMEKYFEYHSIKPKFSVGDKVVADREIDLYFHMHPYYEVLEVDGDRIRLLDDELDDGFWDASGFKLYEATITEGVEMAKHLREVLNDMAQAYNGNHEKTMVGFAGYLAGVIKGAEL